MGKIYTIKELAEMLGVGVGYIYKLTASRQIGFFTTGLRKGIRFTQDDIDAWLKRNRHKSQAEIDSEAATFVALHR